MKIIILVLIFSLLYKLNCEKSENAPEHKDAGQDSVLTKIQETEKVYAGSQKDSADKDDNVQEDEDEDGEKIQVIAPIQNDPADKEDKLQGDENEDEDEDEDGIQKVSPLQKHSADKVKGVMSLFPNGDVADLFGNNQHYEIPVNYQDFGRRFVLQYPYAEKKSADEEAEDEIHKTVQQYIENKQDSQDLLPVKAPPEFVLDIAKKSALLEASKPKNPTDDIIHKNILRSGNYWNNVQKEEIDPKKILRSSEPRNNLESVKVEIKPGSKIFNLISMLKEKSPLLLYVINKDYD